jgi:hypothetical protein
VYNVVLGLLKALEGERFWASVSGLFLGDRVRRRKFITELALSQRLISVED